MDRISWVAPTTSSRGDTTPGRRLVVRSLVVDHLSERCGDDGPLVPALQSLQIFLCQDALANSLGYGDAANAEHGEHGMWSRLGTPLLDRLLAPGFDDVLGCHEKLLVIRGL